MIWGRIVRNLDQPLPDVTNGFFDPEFESPRLVFVGSP